MYNMYSTVMASWKQAFFGLRSVQKAVENVAFFIPQVFKMFLY